MHDIPLLLITILCHRSLPSKQIIPFDTIVTFGDDNTDTGNVYNLTNHQWPLVPPYYAGRFSNGPLWIDELGIANIMNYAYIGATIDNEHLVVGISPPNQTVVPGIRQQIVAYLTANDVTTIDLSRTLYVIWGGTNDYLSDTSLTSNQVASSLIRAVYDLVLVGATQILLMNQPPLQFYPIFSGLNSTLPLNISIVNENNYLIENISEVESNYPGVSIRVFDMYSLITNILSNNFSELNQIGYCWKIVNDSLIFQCSDPDKYVFIDDYHFTTSVHQIIAHSLGQFLSVSSTSAFSRTKLTIFICVIVFIIKDK